MKKGIFTNKYERAAIIGFWRSGAGVDTICEIMPYLFPKSVKRIISRYKNSLKGDVSG